MTGIVSPPLESAVAPESSGVVAGTVPVERPVWFLMGKLTPSDSVRQVCLNATPFRIGRRVDLCLSITDPTISKLHAEIVQTPTSIYIRDLASTNGTYVNGRAVREVHPLKAGDIVQVGHVALRLVRVDPEADRCTAAAGGADRSLALVQFRELLHRRAFTPYYQPIVEPEAETVGYEVLARSRLFGLHDARTMFQAAADLNLEDELSRMLRWYGVEMSSARLQRFNLFLNTHPSELQKPGLIESLRELREANPHQPLTLEIHEKAVADPHALRELRAALTDLDIRLAYDDFGAGQARLVELVEVRPDYLKFDRRLIEHLHGVCTERQRLVASLVTLAKEMGITTLAEGVENEAESLACREIGFDLVQGYYYGRPAPISVVEPTT